MSNVILVGTLGKDPETKTFANGGSLTQFSIATSDSWTDKSTGERKEQTEWHRIVLHNRLGEIAQQYLRKGSKVYIEGSLRTRQWTDQNGQERYTTEIRGEQMQMLDSNNRSQGEQQGQGFEQPRFNNNQQGGYNNNQQSGYGNQGANNQGGYGNSNQASNNQANSNQGNGYANNNPSGFAPKAPAAPAAAPADLDDDLPF